LSATLSAPAARAAPAGRGGRAGGGGGRDGDGFLAQRAIPGVETVEPRRYARALRVGQACGVVVVEPGAGDWLQVTLRFPELTAWPAVIARVRRVFDLAVDPAALAGHLSHDPLLSELIARRPGLRAPGAWDGFELAVRAVL